MPLETMPFGKFKGTPIEELEEGYINWLLEQDYLRDELRERLEQELEGRNGVTPVRSREEKQAQRRQTPAKGKAQRPSEAIPEEFKGYVEAILMEGYRKVAIRYQPGSQELRQLNKAGFYLRDRLGLSK